MSLPEVLRKITNALDQAGFEHMLTGSFASAYYGSPRSTQDIDLVIAGSEQQLRRFVESLPDTEYYVELDEAMKAYRRESMFNVIDLKSGWKIDLITRKSRAFSRVEFSRRRPVKLQATDLFVASAEDVVIAKLEWAKLGQSQRQLEDAAGILRIQASALDRDYLEKWIRELELENEWKAALLAAEI